MKQNRVNLLHVVVNYVTDLLPLCNKGVSESAIHDLDMDAKALVYLSLGNIFFTGARNGREYLYCFIDKKSDFDVARKILHANNIKPRLHRSKYYYTPRWALRSPVSNIVKDKKAQKFADRLMSERIRISGHPGISLYIENIRQNIK